MILINMNSTLASIPTNLRILGLISSTLVLSSWSHAQVDAHPSPIVATIDAKQVKDPISKYMYGMFIEHIGNLINHSLWSEMLDDRKFYFPIDSKPETQPAGAPNPIRQRMQYKKWRPVGPGIQQSGLAVRKGKSYVGRLYLAGTAAAKVKVSLVWGAGPQDRQQITIPTLHS
ncbi:MAG: hypothetical protein DMG64_11240 [Acidobacteria bacterium]|nr:MAG: hypothetical protein DMG64_11240 [Acidobacteriota bacterium]